jgi:hypothetical protein
VQASLTLIHVTTVLPKGLNTFLHAAFLSSPLTVFYETLFTLCHVARVRSIYNALHIPRQQTDAMRNETRFSDANPSVHLPVFLVTYIVYFKGI